MTHLAITNTQRMSLDMKELEMSDSNSHISCLKNTNFSLQAAFMIVHPTTMCEVRDLDMRVGIVCCCQFCLYESHYLFNSGHVQVL